MGSVDYSVDPRMIGQLVEVHATPTTVTVTCNGEVVATHLRCWADRVTITDPAHVSIAKTLRAAFSAEKLAQERASRQHADGHRVSLRALSDCDALFNTGFASTAPEKVTSR